MRLNVLGRVEGCLRDPSKSAGIRRSEALGVLAAYAAALACAGFLFVVSLLGGFQFG